MQLQSLRMNKNGSQISNINAPVYVDGGVAIVDNPFKKTQQMFDNNQMNESIYISNKVENINDQNDKTKKLDQHIKRHYNSSKNTFSNLHHSRKNDIKTDYIVEEQHPQLQLLSSQSKQNKLMNSSQSKKKIEKKDTKNEENQHKFHDLLLMLKTKIYFKQWRKFMPSRILKVLGNWHYNLLSDKTIGFENEKKDMWNNNYESDRMNNNEQGSNKFGNQDEGFYLSELKNLQSFQYNKSKTRNILINLMKQIPLFSASGKFRLIWDVVQMVIIMAFQYFLPLYITFKVPFYEIVHPFIAYIMYFLLLFDILVNMNTTYYDKGKQVTDRKSVFIKYVRTSFTIDILPIIPITIDLFFVSIENSIIRFIFLIFIMKLNRMYSILSKIQDRFHLIASINSYMQLFKLLIVHLLISHYFACLWLLVGRGQSGYTWMVRRDIHNSDWPTQYINSYYFITLTMITVGYGDITPQTNTEIGLCIVTMTFACGVFAYSVNEIGTLIQDLRKNQKEIKKNLQTISKYMHNKNISNELKYEIREYLLYYWTEESNKNGEKENIIINQLSDSLKETLVIEANHLVLSDSPVFRDNFSPEILKKTVPLIKEFRCTPEEVIYFEGETDEGCIYFIEKGSVEIYIDISTGQKEQFKPLKQLKKGDNFGAIGFFTGLHRTQSVRSLEFTTLLMIKREEFLSLLQEYPQDYERFCFLRDKIQIQKDYQKLGLRCYSCRSFYHVLNDCPYLHYVANRFKVIREATSGTNERDKHYSRINRIKYRRTLLIQQDIEQQARIYYEENDEMIDELYDHLDTIGYDNQTQNDNQSYFKYESIGGQRDNYNNQLSTGLQQEEDVRTSSMKVIRRNKQKNTLLPQQPVFRTKQSQDEPITNSNILVAQQPIIQEIRRSGERKGTIQIQNHRQNNAKKLSRIPSSESKNIEKSIEKLGTEKNFTQYATANIIEDKLFIVLQIDMMKNFQFYFPNNNCDEVLQSENKYTLKHRNFYLRDKKRSKRSTIKSSNKIETSSMNSLYNKYEQQKEGEEIQKQQSIYSKYHSKNSVMSRRQSNKHNSNFTQRSSRNTFKLTNIIDQENVNNQLNNNILIENEENLVSLSKISANSDIDINFCPPLPLPIDMTKSKYVSPTNIMSQKWGQDSFGPSLKINCLHPSKSYFEESINHENNSIF